MMFRTKNNSTKLFDENERKDKWHPPNKDEPIEIIDRRGSWRLEKRQVYIVTNGKTAYGCYTQVNSAKNRLDRLDRIRGDN